MNLSSKNINFAKRINQHPELKKRFTSLLNLIENTANSVITVDESEIVLY